MSKIAREMAKQFDEFVALADSDDPLTAFGTSLLVEQREEVSVDKLHARAQRALDFADVFAHAVEHMQMSLTMHPLHALSVAAVCIGDGLRGGELTDAEFAHLLTGWRKLCEVSLVKGK